MNAWKRHLRAAADATEPRPGAVERLQSRAAWPGRLLQRAAIEPGPGAVERLRARRLRARRPPILLPAAALALAAALAAALLIPQAPAPLSERLSAPTPTDHALTPHVALAYAGVGDVAGTERAPRIRWEAGTLEVDVTPRQGIDLSVETDEGTVRVIGTSFSVTRDAMGTTVAVSRGHVRVACGTATERDLRAGDRVECAPVRAAGWIGRTQALMRAGRGTDELLAAIDQGWALAAADDPAGGELVALRIRVLMDAGRYEEAFAAAEAYLASGAAPRRDEVAKLADALRARP